MALSLGSANGDKDVMANLAARLMGKTKTTAAPKPPAAAAPRSMPTTQVQPTATASNVTSSVNHMPKSSVNTENVPPKPTLSDTFVKASEDVKMTDIDCGPSLFGSADQLAEARQFASSATTGGNKSRPASRRRLASKEPERPPSSSSSSSTRTRLAATAPSSGWQAFGVAPTTAQSSPVRTEAFSLFGKAKPLQQKQTPVTLAPAVAPTPAPTPVASPTQRAAPVMTERANSSNIMSSPTKAANNTVNSITKEALKPELSHAHPTVTIPVKKDDSKALQAKQLADITNTFKERAANATSPPHLRSRAAAAGIPARKDTAPTALTHAAKAEEIIPNQKKLNDSKIETPKEAMTVAAVANKTVVDQPHVEKTEAKTTGVQGDQMSIKTVEAQPIDQTRLLVQATNAEKVLHGTQAPGIKTYADSLEKTATLNGTPAVNGAAEVHSTPEKLAKDSTAGTNTEIFRMLESVEKTVTVINARIKRLEEDSFEMQKQLVGLVEERERRQFLGTDSAKMPFGMEVNAANGKTYKVQVSTELKVYELIRRVRAKAELAAMESTNPRVMVDGKVVGHGMMLGELGIANEKKPTVEFMHD